MTSVLVTGASGFVGRALCPRLRAAGHRVAISTRDRRAARGLDVDDVHVIDALGPETDWRPALGGVEMVVHLAARVHAMDEPRAHATRLHRQANARGTLRLAEAAAKAGVRRLVFLSTVKVNGERTDRAPFREGDPPAPADAYARAKWEAETGLAELAARTGLEVVTLRPPLVYGPGVGGNFLTLLKICQARVPLPLAGAANRRSLIFVGNLADAIAGCLDRPAAAGGTYLLRDGEDISTADLLRLTAQALDRPARLFALPGGVLRLAGAVVGKSAMVARLLDSLVVDDGKIRRELGWTPPFTLAHGLSETAAWFRTRGKKERSP
jgi:nucleoside-diphosphate-sugar epimerase